MGVGGNVVMRAPYGGPTLAAIAGFSARQMGTCVGVNDVPGRVASKDAPAAICSKKHPTFMGIFGVALQMLMMSSPRLVRLVAAASQVSCFCSNICAAIEAREHEHIEPQIGKTVMTLCPRPAGRRNTFRTRFSRSREFQVHSHPRARARR
jgi:hypothetical protein